LIGNILGEIRVYSTDSLLLIKSFQAHYSSIMEIKQSPFNVDLIATSAYFDVVKIWSQASDWKLISTVGNQLALYNEFINEDLIACVNYGSSQINIRSIKTGLLNTTINEIDTTGNFITSLSALGSDGTRVISLAVGFNSGKIKIYSIYNSAIYYLYDTLEGHTATINALEPFNFDYMGYIASASDDQTIRMWTSMTDGATSFTLNLEKRLYKCIKTITSEIIAVGSSEGLIQLYNMSSSKVIRNLVGHQGQITCSLDLLNNNQLLVSGDSDGIIKVWNWSTGVCLNSLNSEVLVTKLVILKQYQATTTPKQTSRACKFFRINSNT
jgi:WD40 repeat protein